MPSVTTAPRQPLAAPDGDWIAISGVAAGSDVALLDGWDITMSVDGDEIGGTAACNGFGGAAEIDDDGSFRVGELSWTEMGCESPVQTLEQVFLTSLGDVTHYAVLDDVLTLSSDVDEWVFHRMTPVDDAAIVGTMWVLDTYIDGEASMIVPSMESATLLFGDDGRLTGSTGCRALEGEWNADGGRINVTSLTAIDDPAAGVCAPQSETLDGLVVSVLESSLTVGVDGEQLTLMAPGNQGLSYTAS